MLRKGPRRVATLAALAVWTGSTAMAAADDAANAAEKIARLRQASRELSGLARLRLPADLTADERRETASYTRWLEASSRRLDDLANRWDKALKTNRADASTRRSLRASAETRVARIPRKPVANATDARSADLPMAASRQMHEMNANFSMQYLMLQQDMQQKNREFTMLSNIMKTWHDTAKNAINNLR